jgi:hypothetical protein
MENPRFSLEEYKTFCGKDFGSPEELQRQYESFLSALTEVDESPVPPMSAQQKAEIFQRAWQGRAAGRSPVRMRLAPFFRAAAVFVLGTAFGCGSMFLAMKSRPASPQPATAESPLKVRYTQDKQIYTGRAIRELYPQIENPKVVVEQASDKTEPRRVLYGTLRKGEITVVWNL